MNNILLRRLRLDKLEANLHLVLTFSKRKPQLFQTFSPPMKIRSTYKAVCLGLLLLTLAAYLTVVEGEATSRRRRNRHADESISSTDCRYKKLLSIILKLGCLALAPIFIRFAHCLMTDPATPLLLKEMKRLLMDKHFGNLSNRFKDEDEEGLKE